MALDNYIKLTPVESKSWVLGKEGLKFASEGTPEFVLYQMIGEEGLEKSKVPSDVFKFGFSNGMKKKWFNLQDGNIVRTAENVEDADRLALQAIQNGAEVTKEQTDSLKKRKLISQDVKKSFNISKGEQYKTERKKKVAELTSDMIEKGTWKEVDFKPINFNAKGKEIASGNLHPLLKVRQQFREILLQMGFSEMPTNQYAESSFWNFDTLF